MIDNKWKNYRSQICHISTTIDQRLNNIYKKNAFVLLCQAKSWYNLGGKMNVLFVSVNAGQYP